MNFILRLKNKSTLVALVSVIVSFIYQILGVFNIVIPISQNDIIQGIGVAISVLATLGVLVDPTTSGIKDPDNVLAYNEPRVTEMEKDGYFYNDDTNGMGRL